MKERRVPTSQIPTASSTAHWRLRIGLSVVLAAILVTAFVVAGTQPATKVLRVASAATHPDQARAGIARTTLPPVAITGTVTRPQAGAGCGFSLAEPAVMAPVGHCTVVEIGDSLGSDIGWGLSRQVLATSGLNLVQLDVSSTGLANSSFYNWPTNLAVDLRRYHPQLVLVCLGGNDEQGMRVGGSSVQFPTPPWRDAYIARVRQLVSEATGSGAFVLWIGLPIMEQPSYSQGVEILNALYRTAMSSEPNATFVSTWSVFSNLRGAFQSDAMVDAAWTSLRQPDGIHYSFSGEDVISTFVLREIASIYHVQVAPAKPAVITGWG